MRTASLACMTVGILVALTSFHLPADDIFVVPARRVEPRLKPLPGNIPLHYAEWVIYYCDETGVPVWLASRMFGQETVGDPMSGKWNPKAVSWAGAQGLAQIMPFNIKLFSTLFNNNKTIDPFDPETAIRVGLRYLADLYEAVGNWEDALRSYNGGFSHWLNPKKYGPWPKESIEYAKAILGGR